MNYRFAGRMGCAPPESFLEELFRVSAVPGVISFAGGLPGSAYIDVEGIREAAREVFAEEGRTALQYTTTDGYPPSGSSSPTVTKEGSASRRRPRRSRS